MVRRGLVGLIVWPMIGLFGLADEAHHADSLVITCIDFRYREVISDWIKQKLGKADFVSAAGAEKLFGEAETHDFMLEQVSLSCRLHGIKAVHVFAHWDCGGLGGSEAFATTKEEREAHRKNLRNVVDTIHDKHPELEVHVYILMPDSTVDTVREEEFDSVSP